MYSLLYSAIREIANALAMGIFKLGFERTFSKNSTEHLTKIGAHFISRKDSMDKFLDIKNPVS